MGSFVANPLSGLIEGLLQGHQIATQLHRQAQEDQAFKTNQALHEQNMSIQDIMNRQWLNDNARPVSPMETVDNPAVEGPASPIPGLPNAAGAPAYTRKADKSRTVNYGPQQYELKTPEEQQQTVLDRQIKGNDALELAKGEGQQRVRQSVLKMRGVPIPEDIAGVMRMSPGTLVLPEEIPGLAEHAQQIIKGGYQKLSPGETLLAPNASANSTEGSDAATPGFRTVATGGPPIPTDDFGKYFLPAAAKARGKEVKDLTPEELSDVRAEFTGEAHNPTEASLAWKAVHGRTDLERKAAEAALKRLDQSKIASRPVNQFIAPPNLPQGPVTIDSVPDSIRGTVKSILESRQPMPPLSRNNPTNQAIQFWVNKVAPEYSAAEFPSKNKMLTAYTSGTQSKEISGINTALGHIGVLGDAVDALDNGNVQVLNHLANIWGVQTGATPVTTFQAIVHKVAPELNRAYVGGVGAQGEIKAQESDFDPKMGTKQLKNNVAITTKLLRSKIGSLEQQWKTTMKAGDFEDRFLTPEAKTSIEKWSPAEEVGGKPPLSSFEKK